MSVILYQVISLYLPPPLDYEMGTLPKHSGTSEKTSVVHSELKDEELKIPLDEGKLMKVLSSPGAADSPENFKATQTEITMESIMWETLEGPQYPEKGTEL